MLFGARVKCLMLVVQDNNGWSRETSYIGSEMLVLAETHAFLDTRYQLLLLVASGECKTIPMKRTADTII
jgi:hypothetical protein